MSEPVQVVGIGASAGGLEALERLFGDMPTDTGLAFVVVQHLSPDHKSLMDQLLARRTSIPIRALTDGDTLRPDTIYLAPARRDVSVEGARLRVREPLSSGLHLPVDALFGSLAEDRGESSIAIVLSGTGSDGARGVRSIKENGGLVLAQSTESAKFDGMPRHAAEVADCVLPPGEMPDRLMQFLGHPFVRRSPGEPTLDPEPTLMEEIDRLLRDEGGIDFGVYKPTTVGRRIERRMGICHVRTPSEYLELLRGSSDERSRLRNDLLIGVTRFFRDPDAWSSLTSNVLAETIRRADPVVPLRAWVAACSTGEEAYTLAILMQETMEECGRRLPLKIFASDVNAASIEAAAEGSYPESIVADVSPQRLERYFVRSGDRYVVSRSVRESVIFAQHDLLSDPPFTKLDLVTCRNFLIYVKPHAQRHILSTFHFSLRSDGHLLLGSSETVGDLADAFVPVDEARRILRKVPGALLSPPEIARSEVGVRRARPGRPHPSPRPAPSDPGAELLRRRFHPPAVLVDASFEVVRTYGDVEGLLRIPPGDFTTSVDRMVAPELRVPVSTALHRARRREEPASYQAVPAHTGLKVDIEVDPIAATATNAPLFLIVLRPRRPEDEVPPESYDAREAHQARIHDLETDLAQTRENLQASVEELETSNEELQSTNEELLASNEELQGTNEELNSVNEELYAVNTELQQKIDEVHALANDFDHVMSCAGIGNIFVDRELSIRRFTPSVRDVMQLHTEDIGTPLEHCPHGFEGERIERLAAETVSTGRTLSRQVRHRDGRTYLLRIAPFLGRERAIEGAVLTVVELT